uniref:Uncharacterized protein n=1 Tax=Sphaerodactylus townsendi TaxID=933632 RepID=A0ACB8F630_9SAUR
MLQIVFTDTENRSHTYLVKYLRGGNIIVQMFKLQSFQLYKLSKVTTEVMLSSNICEICTVLEFCEAQRSNKLLWNWIFLDSFFSLSQTAAASRWHSHRAVKAQA